MATTLGAFGGGYTISHQAGQDIALADEVKRELRMHYRTRSFNLDTTAQKGIVTLHGLVPDKETAELAVTIAQRVEKVKAVHSEIIIK